MYCKAFGGVLLTVLLLVFVASNSVSGEILKSSSESKCEVEYKDFIANIINKFLIKLRDHMSTGIPSMGIPPLDPLHIPDETFSVKKPYEYNFSGKIDNSKMEGLKGFKVKSIDTSILRMQANVSVVVPYLSLTGQYALKGKALSVIPVRGKGPYILKPSDVRMAVYTKMTMSHGHFQMTSMDFKLNAFGVYARFDGFEGGGMTGNVVNSLLNRFGLSLLRKIEASIHERLRTALLDEINGLLKDVPLADLIGLMGRSSHCANELKQFIL